MTPKGTTLIPSGTVSPRRIDSKTKSGIPSYHFQFKLDPTILTYYSEAVYGLFSNIKEDNEKDSILFNSHLRETNRPDNIADIADHLSKSYNQAYNFDENTFANHDLRTDEDD